MHRRTAILLIFFAAAARALFAEDMNAPKVVAEVKPEKATVGDRLTYRLTVTGAGLKNIRLTPPSEREYFPDKGKEPSMTVSGKDDAMADDNSRIVPLYIIHSITKSDRSNNDMADLTVIMHISYYRPGTYSLPEIGIKGEDGITIGYKIPTIEIMPLNKKGEFQDLEPPLDLGGNYFRLSLVLAGLLAAALIGFFTVRYFKRRYDMSKPATAVIPPLEIFLNEVRALGGERLIDEGRIEEFVFGISAIFRKFLSLQFNFDAIEMTTYEIEKKLTRILQGPGHDARFHTIMRSLDLWDLSKFAEFSPSKDVLQNNLAEIVALVKHVSEDMGHVASRV
jgi:hypothetical protein